MPRRELERLQSWMQAVILEPGPVAAAIASKAATRHMARRAGEAAILPSATLEAGERLDIYRDMYSLRLQEALRFDYPLVERLLGADTFAELAELYIRHHPSRSYTLNRLGDRFPEFIATVKGLPRPALAMDLARYELARTRVLDAGEAAAVSAATVAEVDPEVWESARLRPVPAFELLECRYPVHLFDGAALRARKTWLAICRRAYVLDVAVLTRSGYGLLSRLAAGAPLGRAVGESGARPRDLGHWFEEWTAAGFFSAIEVAGGGRSRVRRG